MGFRKKIGQNIDFFGTYFSDFSLFWGLGAVRGPRGYENRVRGVFLHILAVGNLWGILSNRFLIDLGTFHFSGFFGGFLGGALDS